jgi:peptidoglycan glycosyltransferase
MNQPITRLFLLVLVMFALLVGFTSRWSVFDASALRSNPENARPGLEAQRVQRGAILAADGTTVLAQSVRQSDGVYQREYPQGAVFAAPIGYYDPYNGSYQLEQYRTGALTGTPAQHSSLLDQLEDKQTSGDEVITTLDAHAQQVAMSALAGRPGAVVAIVPSTGAIRVMASSPSYNPNVIKNTKALGALEREGGAPLLDRAVAAQYAPGSTFKVVTATAAIDSGLYTPNSIINGDSPITVASRPLQNDGNYSYGPVTLSYALTNSINTVYAQVALKVGAQRLQTYMQRFGFYQQIPLDLPADEIAQSGVVDTAGRRIAVTAGADIGRTGIGEGGLLVTPLQMAMVASAVADNGRLMVPHLTKEVVNPDGQVVERVNPRLFNVVMKPSTAQEVGSMMADVVRDGTGTAAALAGITVAGKTGTAQDCSDLANPACQYNQDWFIAYVPGQDIALAVTLEHQQLVGGEVAAPIAREVLLALLGRSA